MMGRLWLVLAAGTALLAACGSGGGTGGRPVEIATTPLAGTIGGATWTLVSAESSAFLSDGETSFFVTAYAEAVTPCAGAGGSTNGNELLLEIPKTAGDYSVSLSLPQTFYLAATSNNLVATSGRLRVDEVTPTSLRGGAHFAFDAYNEVDGVFTVAICPP